ncbi:MAG: T9SS type A sorting domain-containing protein [Chitinophagales bacterium]
MKKVYILIFFSLYISNVSAQCEGGRYINKIFSQTIRTKNITYSTAKNAAGNMQAVLMDVFEPVGDTASLRPLVVFEHGGAYWTGTKDYQSQIAMGEDFAKRGYVVSSATYRLEPSFISLIFQDLMLKAVGRGVQDTKQLVRYFFNSARDSANPYRIDTTKIFLCGGSAGAFNVMHTVYLDSLDNLFPDWKNSLTGIGGVFGEYDFIDFGKTILGVVNINGALGDKSFLDNNHTNFLSVHNIWDPEIPFNRGRPYNIASLMYVDGSNILHPYAENLGMYNPFYIIPDAGHTSYSTDLFGTVVQPFFDSTVWYMKNFFAYQLGCPDITTGINHNTTVKSLNAFPNPTFDELYFEGVQQYIGQTISVTDISGKEVYKERFTGKPLSTQSIGLTKGMYIVRLTDNKTHETSVGKILVE